MAPAAASATATSPWGTAGGKTVGGRNHDGFARRTLHLHGLPGKRQGRDPFEHVAVSLVKQCGGIDRMARVYAIQPVDHERLCGSR